MSSLNKTLLIGHLGQDPERRALPNGEPVTILSVATNRQWRDKQGEKQQQTEWHRVVVYGKLAELAGQYLNKGRMVYLEGRIQTRKWTDKQTGEEKHVTEIIVDSFNGALQMLDGKQNNDHGHRPQSPSQPSQSQPSQSQFSQPHREPAPRNNSYANARDNPAPQPAPQATGQGFDDFDDDIPF